MSVADMIAAIEAAIQWTPDISESDGNKIIAALRAGDAMRTAFWVDEEDSVQVKHHKLAEAAGAWDKVTKG